MPALPVEEVYPRKYGLSTDKAVFQGACGAILLLGGALALWFNGLAPFTRFPNEDGILISAASIGGLYLIVHIADYLSAILSRYLILLAIRGLGRII
jgi:hypothetical protein